MAREVMFGVALLVALLAGAAQLWGRDRAYYQSFAREARLDAITFHHHDPEGSWIMDLQGVFVMDDQTRRYVVEGAGVAPDMRLFYDASELSHLADVRAVYGAVSGAGAVALLVAILVGRGLRRASIRRAALVGAAAVVLVGAVAAVAFEPLFLAFHEVFFPQGNFLFDPSRENLTLLYPEGYWLGVTLRLGATVIAACLLVGGVVSLPIRSSAVVRVNKGIVA